MKQVCRSANPSLSSRDCSSKVEATDDRGVLGKPLGQPRLRDRSIKGLPVVLDRRLAPSPSALYPPNRAGHQCLTGHDVQAVRVLERHERHGQLIVVVVRR